MRQLNEDPHTLRQIEDKIQSIPRAHGEITIETEDVTFVFGECDITMTTNHGRMTLATLEACDYEEIVVRADELGQLVIVVPTGATRMIMAIDCRAIIYIKYQYRVVDDSCGIYNLYEFIEPRKNKRN